jgi:hypothetical protein
LAPNRGSKKPPIVGGGKKKDSPGGALNTGFFWGDPGPPPFFFWFSPIWGKIYKKGALSGGAGFGALPLPPKRKKKGGAPFPFLSL